MAQPRNYEDAYEINQTNVLVWLCVKSNNIIDPSLFAIHIHYIPRIPTPSRRAESLEFQMPGITVL